MQNKDAKRFEIACLDSNICPHTGALCYKKTKGVVPLCSYIFNGDKQIVCPNRFIPSGFLQYIASEYLKTNNYEVLNEVKIGNNYIDFIVLNGDDYVAVELQALDTCGSLKHYEDPNGHKPLCINWKTTAKTIIAQMISKVRMFKKSGRKVVLVLQNTLLEYFRKNGYIKKYTFEKNDDLYLLPIAYEGEELKIVSPISVGIEELIECAFREEVDDADSVVFKRAMQNKK